ncbi:MAG: NADPH-dependent FMN reductase [Myxococcota bacterium]
MSLIVTISGSPAAQSRTRQLSEQVALRLRAQQFDVASIDVRDLPPDDLIYASSKSRAIHGALELVERALGVVILTPVYKASFSGVLKTFLDLLPQYGLQGKVVLPLLVGGTNAHVLALDYALRPVLLSLGAQHVVAGLFILDKLLQRDTTGALAIDAEILPRFEAVVGDFIDSLSRRVRASA